MRKFEKQIKTNTDSYDYGIGPSIFYPLLEDSGCMELKPVKIIMKKQFLNL